MSAGISVESVRPVSASTAVVERVARREGVHPTELTPLYDVVDPDALEAFVASGTGDGEDRQIEFSYHGYAVTVDGAGVVSVEDPEAPKAADAPETPGGPGALEDPA